MPQRDSAHNILPVCLVKPGAYTSTQAAASATAVDTLGFESVWFGVIIGTWTDGTFTFTVQDSPDNSTFTANTTNILGTTPVISDNTKVKTVLWFGYNGMQRYVAINAAASGTTTGMIYGVIAVCGMAHSDPTF